MYFLHHFKTVSSWGLENTSRLKSTVALILQSTETCLTISTWIIPLKLCWNGVEYKACCMIKLWIYNGAEANMGLLFTFTTTFSYLSSLSHTDANFHSGLGPYTPLEYTGPTQELYMVAQKNSPNAGANRGPRILGSKGGVKPPFFPKLHTECFPQEEKHRI